MNTKSHAVTDANGRPIKFFMTAGQVSDYTDAAALLSSLPEVEGRLSAQATERVAVGPKLTSVFVRTLRENGGAIVGHGIGGMLLLRAAQKSSALALSGDRERAGIFAVDSYRKVRLACAEEIVKLATASLPVR